MNKELYDWNERHVRKIQYAVTEQISRHPKCLWQMVHELCKAKLHLNAFVQSLVMSHRST